MKAVVYERYGGPEVLRYTEIETPVPAEGEVLVRVKASSVNAADYRMMRADPFLVRLANGLSRPTKTRVLGSDVAGVVEQVGPGVTRFQAGDAVFGNSFHTGLGAFAEYVRVSENALASLPSGLSCDEAAAVPLAGITALQGIRDLGGAEPGQSVLVQGAGGGVGTFVVEIAKAMGADVTAVCGAGSAELVASLGADRVLDYTKDDFAREGRTYDVILGVNGYRSLADYRRCLGPGGRYVMIGGANRQIFEALLLGRLRFLGSGKTARVLTLDKARYATDLRELSELLTGGALRPVIDRMFTLEETPEAIRFAEKGHVRGKVVIRVAD
jgi:NADPH:quinone reductase-like Zn-dependent oxidoreductase